MVFTGRHGAVEPHEGLIRVICRYDADERETTLEVIDNGPGISPAVMNHLFKLFQSTKGNRGTGLGLTVIKRIPDRHEGPITARSAPGEGATFTPTTRRSSTRHIRTGRRGEH